MSAKIKGRNYSIRGLATKRKRRKTGAKSTKGQPGLLFMTPPDGSWYDSMSGKVKDKK